jgi:hypothetical protein
MYNAIAPSTCLACRLMCSADRACMRQLDPRSSVRTKLSHPEHSRSPAGSYYCPCNTTRIPFSAVASESWDNFDGTLNDRQYWVCNRRNGLINIRYLHVNVMIAIHTSLHVQHHASGSSPCTLLFISISGSRAVTTCDVTFYLKFAVISTASSSSRLCRTSCAKGHLCL